MANENSPEVEKLTDVERLTEVEKLTDVERLTEVEKLAKAERLSFAGGLAKDKVEVKKFDDLKETLENKATIAVAEGRVVEKKKTESKPAVEKVSGKDKKTEGKVELEREYVVPLRKGTSKAVSYKRAKKAVRVLKEFVVKHMGVRDRDLKKVKVDINLNNEIWFRGIKKPLTKVKVKAKKIDGIVYVELAEIPAVVGFKIAREVRKKAGGAVGSRKSGVGGRKSEEKVDDDDKDKDGVSDKLEEKEDARAGAEMGAKIEKADAKIKTHTTDLKHEKRSMPKRKVLK